MLCQVKTKKNKWQARFCDLMLLLTTEFQPAADHLKYSMAAFGDEWERWKSRHVEQIVGHEYPWESPVLHAVSPNHEQELFLAVCAH